VEVRDEGEGIAEVDLEKIFDEFVQLGKTQLTEGTGLGLPISRRLAEMLQGTLDVESEVGVGSVFRLTLPATAESPNGARGTRTIDQNGALSSSADTPGAKARESTSSATR
jgi:signal transduction histidine kinase